MSDPEKVLVHKKNLFKQRIIKKFVQGNFYKRTKLLNGVNGNASFAFKAFLAVDLLSVNLMELSKLALAQSCRFSQID